MYLNVFDDSNYIDLYNVGATIVLLAQKNQLLNETEIQNTEVQNI